jgi:hypothetical protein
MRFIDASRAVIGVLLTVWNPVSYRERGSLRAIPRSGAFEMDREIKLFCSEML